jgi:hypothetical protein
MPASAPAPQVNLQGIYVPQSSVNPELFFRLTRRLTVAAKTIGAFAGLGQTDTVTMLQTGILGGISIKFSGNVAVTLGGGTAATTSRWPYDLLRAVRFTANGQSNLINVSGAHLKLRDIMGRGDLNDRGVANGILGASPGTSRTQGTLALSEELWGLGQGVTAIVGAPTNYPVELNWFVPVAFDQLALTGAIFAQTSATDLLLQLDWAPSTDLFALTGAATAVVTGSVVIEPTLYSIPVVNGDVVVPDLSVFHSIIMSRTTAIGQGDNEIRLAGQGVGRQLLRLWWRTFTGAGVIPPALPLNATNYGQVAWRYGSNDTPEIYTDGRHLAYANERLYSSDIGQFYGFGVFDFATEHAFRDSVDEGAATELRLLINLVNSPTAPVVEYVQETVFAGAAAA